MARSTRSSEESVSLFPFLAVLVCAMGALIFLLLVTVRQIRDQAYSKQQAEQAAVASISEPEIKLQPESEVLPVISPDPEEESETIVVVEEPEPPTPTEIPAVPAFPDELPSSDDVPIVTPDISDDELIAKAKALRLQRIRERQAVLDADWEKRLAGVEQRLRQSKNTLGDLNKNQSQAAQILRTIVEEIEDRKQQLAQAKTQTAEKKKELNDIELESLRVLDEIQKLQFELAKAKKTQKKATSKYRLVPYDGITGTTRRPIYIECNEKGIQFQPENVTLTAADMEGFSTYYNPLLIGTRALVHFWRGENAKSGSKREPYILLVVKPEGTMAFYAARQLLRDLRVPYGYELVDEKFPLDYPEKNAEAERVLKEAIVDVLRQRNQVAENVLEGAGSSKRGGTGGGFTVPEKPKPHPSNFQPVERPAIGEAGNRGTSPQQLTEQVTRDRNDRNNNRKSNRKSKRSRFKPLPDGELLPGEATELGQSTNRSPAGTGSERSLTQRSDRQREGIGQPQSRGQFAEQDPFQGQADPSVQSSSELLTSQQNSTNANRSDQQRIKLENASPNNSGRPDSSNEPRPGMPRILPPSPEQAQRSVQQSPWRSASQNASQNFASTGQSARQFPPISPLPPMRSSVNTGSGQSSAYSGKRQWGIPNRSATIGIEKTVLIRISHDQIKVGNQQAFVVGQGETAEQLQEQVLQQIDANAQSWGAPPRGFYWAPSLKCEVAPGGNLHFDRLERRFRQLNLNTVAEPTFTASPDLINRLR